MGEPEAMLPSPFVIPVRVVDEAGAPIAGARVAVQDGSTRVLYQGLVGTTDAEGRAALPWGGWRDPFEAPPQTLYVTATRTGFAEGASGWLSKQPFVGCQVVKRHQGKELVVPLQQQAEVARGVVDPAFAGRSARVEVMGLVQMLGANGHYFLPRSYDVVVAADGSYEVPQLTSSASTVRLVLPPLAGRRVDLVPTHAPALPSAAAADCATVVGQVIDERGGPASGAQVLLTCHGEGRIVQTVVLDAAGKFERTLQHGRWIWLAMDATGWATSETDSAATEPLALRLVTKPQRRVRVLDSKGRPVAGAAFEPGEFLAGVQPAHGLDALLAELGWNTFAQHMRSARTDAQGEATLHCLPWPGVTPKAFAFVGDYQRRSDDCVVEPADDVLVVTLR
jgi:hypothetical protein